MNQTPPTDIYNEDILNLMPINLTKVIEIGTGSGALANAYLKNNQATNYIGVEIDDKYAILSERFCKKVYLENFENPSKNLTQELHTADLVIFSDVLEHMYNPWKILEFLSIKMPKSGSIIASIPNIQHWSIQARLINGDFNYSDTGLLDKTHIRFFTRKTIVKLFEENGFSIETIKPRIFNFPEQDKYLEWIKNNSENLSLNITEAISNAATFQYVIKANIK